jgi:hypothetical protein
MAGIHVYNKTVETHNGENNFYIGRGSVLGNPYTHISDRKTKAIYVVKDRETAINSYSHYFDVMYGSNLEFTKAIDEIYRKYAAGEDVYLGCYCHPKSCHGDVIAKKLMQKLIREKFLKQ